MATSRAVAICAGLFACGVLGCGGGPAMYPVTGKITVGGQPASGVSVSLMPTDPAGVVASGQVQEDGTFKVYTLLEGAAASEGALPGQYKVVLSGSAMASDYASLDPAEMQGAAGPPAGGSQFPKEYLSAETSPKTVDVVAGANELNLEL